MEKIVFISLPIADFQTIIIDCVNSCLKNNKHNINESTTESISWFDLNELVAYDPERRTKHTFYGYVHFRTIPFHKKGKKLIFLKSEIDIWLKEGRKRTIQESALEADKYLKMNG